MWELESAEYTVVQSVELEAVTVELYSVKTKLTPSCVKCAISRWRAHSVTTSARKVDENVSNALMVLYEKVAHEIKRKVSIVVLVLKDALK